MPDNQSPARLVSALRERLESEIVGQRALLDRLIVALLAGGHVLIEGVPGLAKTRTARAFAQALDLPFRRVQFTPDLLPADLTGTQVYRPASGTFDVRPGPIITGLLLADEINRAPAKVQSALLEAMQEGQVTVGDETLRLPDPFWVIATQNPIEQEGTYPLPEAQLDRFMLKLAVDYPSKESELAMLDLPAEASATIRPPLFGAETVRRLRQAAASITIVPAVKEYIVDLVRATREPALYGLAELTPLVEFGAGPRASIALVASSKAHALLLGRDYVVPHDVKSLARDVLRHRVLMSHVADAEGVTADDFIGRLLDHLKVP